MQFARRLLQNCCKLRKDNVTVLMVLDRELALSQRRIVIEEYLAFFLFLADKYLDCRPAAWRVYVEATTGSLREIVSEIDERKRKSLYPVNFARDGFCLK